MAEISNNKVALVTGANRGIGFEAVRQLAQKGFTVLLGARDTTHGHEAEATLRSEGLDVHFVQLDTTNSESIHQAAQEVSAKYSKLDVLINNAGIFMDWGIPAAETPMNILRQTFDTNFFGVWETIQIFLPLIYKSEAGRIVNVSSRASSLALVNDPNSSYDRNRVPAYQASKVALNAVTSQFARELRETTIKVNSVCPGWVNSGGPGAEYAPRTVQQGARIFVEIATLPADGPTGGWFDDDGSIPW